MAKDVVSITGMVVESTVDSDQCETSSFMRIRVNIDVTKPLCRGRKTILQNREESLVSFKYERLPMFVIGVVVSPTTIRTILIG